jgi:phosphate:Na+ symporter
MSELQPFVMAIELLGGLALFLYGMEKMTDGLKAAAGSSMNALLKRVTGNRVAGALTGIVVTAVIQSSSVTTVLVVGFVSAGLMTLIQSVGVIFGASVGTTVTAQIVAFNTTALALPLITIGFAMTFFVKRGVARHYGAMLMGLGLIFFGMAAMGSAMLPLRTHEGFAELMISLEYPLLGMLAGAVFTALVQSSSATIGLAVVMATQGLIVLPAGIAIVFGAMVGTCVTALLASLGKTAEARRAATVHVLFNLLGALLWLPFIDQLAWLSSLVSPTASDLEGADRLAAEAPRQIANAATIWALANVAMFLPFSGVFAALACRIVPDRVAPEKVIIKPKFLDDELLRLPSLALERARLELGHMASLVDEMLVRIEDAFRERDSTELSRQHDQVVVLRDAVVAYLQQLGRGELTDEEADEHARLVAAVWATGGLSDAIARELAPMAETVKESGITPSEETRRLLIEIMQLIEEAARSALQSIANKDERAAQSVIAMRRTVQARSADLLRQQAGRLREDDPERLLKHRVQVDLLDKLRRVFGAAEDMAVSVLPRAVLSGEI